MTQDQAQAFKDALRNNKSVLFTYVKLSGEKRAAHGTLNREVIESEHATPKGTDMPEVPNYIRYYDLDKHAWRTATVSTIDEDYEIEDKED